MKINRVCSKEEKNKKGVYKISNTHNGNLYVGSTRRPFRIRFNAHSCALFGNWHSTPHLQNAFNKYDCEWNFEILEIIDDDYQIREREMYWIRSLKNQGIILYNNHDVTTDDVFCHTDETKRRISQAKKGTNKGILPKNFEEFKRLQKRSIVEKENGIVIKEYESAVQAGRELGVDYKLINNVLRGVSKSCRLFPGKSWEYKDGKSSRKVISKSKNKGMKAYSVKMINKNGSSRIFISIKEAMKELNLCKNTIRNSCQGKTKSCWKLNCRFEYVK